MNGNMINSCTINIPVLITDGFVIVFGRSTLEFEVKVNLQSPKIDLTILIHRGLNYLLQK